MMGLKYLFQANYYRDAVDLDTIVVILPSGWTYTGTTSFDGNSISDPTQTVDGITGERTLTYTGSFTLSSSSSPPLSLTVVSSSVGGANTIETYGTSSGVQIDLTSYIK